MTNSIVVLDGYTLNPGDLSWQPFATLAPLVVYDRTKPSEIVARALGARWLLTNKTPITAETIEQLPNLEYIGVLATGYNAIDVIKAAKRRVIVSNVPAYGTESVAQHVFALLLELTNHVHEHASAVREGRWKTSEDWCFMVSPLTELSGKTMGIIGFGRIGRQVAKIARAVGMDVLAYDAVQATLQDDGSFEWAALNRLLERSDVVSLHCPLVDETRGMINASTLSRMKPTALLLNASRGPLIVEKDLVEALNEGRLAGAGLDVLAVEPPEDNPLIGARNCVITPHIAWASREARERLLGVAAENLAAFIAGRAQNVVAGVR